MQTLLNLKYGTDPDLAVGLRKKLRSTQGKWTCILERDEGLENEVKNERKRCSVTTAMVKPRELASAVTGERGFTDSVVASHKHKQRNCE